MDINGVNITPETNTIKIKSSYQTILDASMASAFDYDKMFSKNTEKKWNPAKFTAQVAAPEDAGRVLDAMHETEEGKNAAVIGKVTEAFPGRVILKTAFGGSRILQKLSGAQLPRIC